MIEPLWWIRIAGVATAPVRNREPQVSRRDRPTRAAFLYPDKISILSARAKALLY